MRLLGLYSPKGLKIINQLQVSKENDQIAINSINRTSRSIKTKPLKMYRTISNRTVESK